MNARNEQAQRRRLSVRRKRLLGRMVFVFESHDSLLCRHGTHVDEPPPMAIWVDKAMCIHEAVILRLVVGRAARGDRFGDKTIFCTVARSAPASRSLRERGAPHVAWCERGHASRRCPIAQDNSHSFIRQSPLTDSSAANRSAKQRAGPVPVHSRHARKAAIVPDGA